MSEYNDRSKALWFTTIDKTSLTSRRNRSSKFILRSVHVHVYMHFLVPRKHEALLFQCVAAILWYQPQFGELGSTYTQNTAINSTHENSYRFTLWDNFALYLGFRSMVSLPKHI